MTGLVTKRVEYSRPEVSLIFEGELTKPKVAQKRSVESHTLVHTLQSKRPMPRLGTGLSGGLFHSAKRQVR
jgi:hypothetical protein